MAQDSRARLVEAAYACVARYGIAKTTMDDIAREAGMSRATAYRHFPGGKDEATLEAARFETANFFTELARVVGPETDLEGTLVRGLMYAREAVETHVVLQRVLRDEPERLVMLLTVDSERVLKYIRGFLIPRIAAMPGAPDDVAAAADYLGRMVLSFIGSPGRWDFSDPADVRRLVRTELLAGIESTT